MAHGVALAAIVAGVANAFAQAYVSEIRADDIGGMAPTGIAIDRTLTPETLYIADETNGRILKYNAATGSRIAVYGSTGFGNGQFNRPYGIAIDPATRDLYVAERGNGRVQRITNTGTFVMKWGEHSAAPNTPQGTFNEPIGIAAAPDGHVYVVDKGNNRIQKFRVAEAGGVWQVQNIAMFGSSGAALGELNRPYGIALESAGAALWVADAGNHRIQRFSITGDPLKAIGVSGSAGGQFNLPTWVGIDGSGSLYVTETNSDPQDVTAPDINQQRVQRFRSTGDYDQFSWGGSYGTGPGQFRLPFCVTFGPESRAFVSDYYNQRVQIFDLAVPPPSARPVVTSPAFATGVVGEPFSYQITADKPVDSYAATGLPAGLNVDPATGLITGTLSAAGQTVATLGATNAAGSGSASLTIEIAPAEPTPGTWLSQDIGAVAAAGGASESGGVVTLRGSGADIWERADEFRFRHQTLTGDGEIVARVVSLQNTHGWAKAGVMLRESLAPGSPHVFMCLSAANGSSLQRRTIAGGDSVSTPGPWVGAPRWVRLVRSGNAFTGAVSADGVAWTEVATVTVTMASSVQAGLAVTSHNDGVLCTATFDTVDLRETTAPAAPLAPSALTAAAASSSEIGLSWTDEANNETGFEIERSTNNVDFVRIGTVGANVTTFAATGLSAATTHYFRVRATGAGGNSTYSNTVSSTTPPAATLAAPSGLAASAVSSTQARLTWTDNAATETGFEWALSTDNANFTWSAGIAADVTTITVSGLAAETTYYFRVRAVQGETRSDASNTASATTPANPPPSAPAAPSGLTATVVSETEVRLSWTDNSANEDDFQVEMSGDNQTFSLVTRTPPNATNHLLQGLTAATQYYFRVRAGNAGGLSAYTPTVSATTPGTAPQPVGTLTRVDIGAVAAAGSLSQAGAMYSVAGSGEDIWGAADEFCFAYTAWNGDGTLVARLTSQQDTDNWAKAGIMLRESLTAGSRHVFVAVTPRGITGMQTRTATGGSSTFASSTRNYVPNWLRLVRSGTTIHASHSADGASWTAIGSVTLDLPAALYAGLAVSSHRDGTLGTATFDSLSVNAGAPPPPESAPMNPSGLTAAMNAGAHVSLNWTDNSSNETSFQLERSAGGGSYAVVANTGANVAWYTDTSVVAGTSYTYRVRAMNGATASGYSNIASITTPPASTPGGTWQHVDVGVVGIPGSDDAMGNTITVRGSGADIWDNGDGFRFLYQVLSGDCQIEARVASIGATHGWAKAGVMIRESLAPGARNVFMCATSANGLSAQWRGTTSGNTSSTRGPWGVGVPYWVRLVRTGSTIVASISPDGTAWSTVSTVTLPISGDVYVGFAVTSHDNSQLNTSTFSDPAITPR